MIGDESAAGSEPFEELVDHVDEQGNVIEVVTRGQMRAGNLRHRCTYVFVLRHGGRLLVHQRADWKSIYPGWWDVAFGGVCGAGEPWVSSAERELAEEAGITGVELESLGQFRYDADDGHIIGRAYVARTDAAAAPGDGEVVAVDEVPIDDLDSWLAGRSVCTDSATAALPLLRSRLAGDALDPDVKKS